MVIASIIETMVRVFRKACWKSEKEAWEPIFSKGHGDDGEKIESSGRSETMKRMLETKTNTIDKNKKDKNGTSENSHDMPLNI